MRFSSGLISSLALLLLGCPGGLAQVISGQLHDRTGAVISSARVLLMNEDYVKLAEMRSDDRGEFRFEGLKPALYFVQAKKPMFQITQQHVYLEPNHNARVHLIASVASGEESYGVIGTAAPGLDPAPAKAQSYRAGGKVEGFRRLSGRPPQFPEAAKARGAHGTVVLYGTIQVDGTLRDIVTLESPDAELEQASLGAFRKWRYAPMNLDGVPVESYTVAMFEFKHQ